SSLRVGWSRSLDGVRSLVMLASAQQILRESDEALHIALQLTTVHQRLFQLVRQVGRRKIEAPPRPVAEADQLLVGNIRQRDNAVMQTVLGQPCAPVFNL